MATGRDKVYTTLRKQELELLYEMTIINDITWRTSEVTTAAALKCKHCNTVFNHVDFTDGECPFCRKLV